MVLGSMRHWALVCGLALVLTACAGGGSAPPPVPTPPVAGAPAPDLVSSAYKLASGDRLKVTVFRHEDLSGEFALDGAGNFAMPLIGQIDAYGLTTREVEQRIQTKLSDGYLVDPQVAVEVLNYRPFYILGEVKAPGAYPYVNGMTVLNAVALAGNPDAKGRGPLVILNDTIHYAREAQKMHTTRMDTFHSPNRGIAGMMNTGKAFFYSKNDTRLGPNSEFSVAGKGTNDLPRVEIVYSYANLGPDVVDFLVKQGVQGIVLAGVGDGNSTDAVIAALGEAVKKGVAVVRSSRVGSGVVDRNVEINDDKMGFIAGMELSPQKARILLMLGLTKTGEAKKLQQYFYEY